MNQQMSGPEGLLGRVIGGYRLERILGDGGTGIVYLGRRVSAANDLPEQVAIKTLKLFWYLGGQQQEELRTRFRRELDTWRRLHHPHILSIISSGQQDGLPFLVLPYVEGGTLADRMASWGKAMSLSQVAHYLQQLGDALDYAHQQGVIHRDVKPSNVLIDTDDDAYLTDFSIAKVFEGTQTTLTGTGVIVGTPAYMAPEQQRTGTVAATVDIYSLGVVLYQMVTGQLPFSGGDPVEVLHGHRHDLPPPPRRARPDLPAAAEAVILKALEKQPAQRFQSAGALARAFAAGLQKTYVEGLLPDPAAAAPTVYPPVLAATVTARPPDSTIVPRRVLGLRALGVPALALVLIVSAVSIMLLNGLRGGTSSPGSQTTIIVYPPTATVYPPTSTTRPGGPTPTPYPPTATPDLTPISGPPGSSPTAPFATFTPTPTFTAVPPTPTATPIVLSGNVADQAALTPGGTNAVVDENLSTEWVGGLGAAATITFSWSVPVTIHHIIVWDRNQSATDNNQINLLGITLSDGTVSHNINMVSGGPRCADITLASNHTVTWVQVYPWDSSGNNGYREIEIWATTGSQSSGLTCSNGQTM